MRPETAQVFEYFENLGRLDSIVKEIQSMKKGWYANSSYVGVQSGPFKTEAAARGCMRLTATARAKQFIAHGTRCPDPHDLQVWYEEGPKKAKGS